MEEMNNQEKLKEPIEETTEEMKETPETENETAGEKTEPVTEKTSEEENGEEGQAADEAGEQPEDEAEGDNMGLFKKKKDKKDELIEELTDKYKRTFAEFDNFRKRSEKEKTAMYEIGAKSMIERILPVVDNFERGFSAVSEEERATPFAEGMEKIYQQLIKTLEDAGVKEIEALGKEFDPNLHNAVMHVEDDAFGENTVAEVLQKGYTYRDSVVRHSMVKVAN